MVRRKWILGITSGYVIIPKGIHPETSSDNTSQWSELVCSSLHQLLTNCPQAGVNANQTSHAKASLHATPLAPRCGRQKKLMLSLCDVTRPCRGGIVSHTKLRHNFYKSRPTQGRQLDKHINQKIERLVRSATIIPPFPNVGLSQLAQEGSKRPKSGRE